MNKKQFKKAMILILIFFAFGILTTCKNIENDKKYYKLDKAYFYNEKMQCYCKK